MAGGEEHHPVIDEFPVDFIREKEDAVPSDDVPEHLHFLPGIQAAGWVVRVADEDAPCLFRHFPEFGS